MATVIVKGIEACNGRCAYCAARPSFGPDRGDHPAPPCEGEASGGSDRMPRALGRGDLARVLRLLRDAALRRGDRRIAIIWHGGEPLLLDDAFYEQALALEARILAPAGIRCGNRIQTNLTRLEPERVPLLGRLLGPRGTVGTSADPLPGIRRLAGDPDGEAYRARWERGVRLLRAAGIRYGIVYVVHRGGLDRLDAIYRWLRAEHPDAGVRFNPIYREGEARDGAGRDLAISPEAWGEALMALYRLWCEDGRPRNVLPFAAWEAARAGRGAPPSCEASGRCARDHWGVDPRGDLYLCGRSIDGKRLRYGSARSLDADGLLGHPLRRALANRSTWLREGPCRGCRWWPFCRGGCPNDAFLAEGTPFARTGWCAGLRRFFEAAFDGRAAASLPSRSRALRPAASRGSVTDPPRPLRYAIASTRGNLARIVAAPARRDGIELRGGGWMPRDLEPIAPGMRIRLEARAALDLDPERLAGRAGPVPLVVWPPEGGRFEDLARLLAAGLPVLWQGREDPGGALRFYLHDPACRGPLEPFHGLLEAMVAGRERSLWEIAGPCPARRVFFDAEDRVAATPEDLDAGRLLGRIGDGAEVWIESRRARAGRRAPSAASRPWTSASGRDHRPRVNLR